jgi:hypothetical protein
MGLDMYLNGEKYFYGQRKFCEKRAADEPSKIGEIYELAYWRKHPDLHGFIVETFADGVDNCQRIWLSEENIETIIKAVKDASLPHTEGFFFGESENDEAQRNEDVQLLEGALAWVKTKEDSVWRSLIYQASW